MKELIFAAPFRGVDPVDSESFKGIIRRSAGVVEPARLESVYARKGIKGSNPFSSAGKIEKPRNGSLLFRHVHCMLWEAVSASQRLLLGTW